MSCLYVSLDVKRFNVWATPCTCEDKKQETTSTLFSRDTANGTRDWGMPHPPILRCRPLTYNIYMSQLYKISFALDPPPGLHQALANVVPKVIHNKHGEHYPRDVW